MENKRKVAIMIDSEVGWSEKEARKMGFFYVPIVIYWNDKQGYSGIDYDLKFIYDNLDKNTDFKTATSEIGMIQDEYRKALKTADHVLFIPISKHLSSQVNSGKIAADDDEFRDKVTVYDSEFIGPWILAMSEKLVEMMKNDSTLDEYLKILDESRGNMFGWLFPKNLERLKASGRLSKAAYIAGSLLRIVPVTPIINGKLSSEGIIKTRSVDKALDVIVKNSIKKYKELTKKGLNVEILFVILGKENDELKKLKKKFSDNGFENVGKTWLPPAVVGHVGLNGLGAGVSIKFEKEK